MVSTVNVSLRSKLKQMRFIGRMVGFAICENMLLDLHLSKPFVKQVSQVLCERGQNKKQGMVRGREQTISWLAPVSLALTACLAQVMRRMWRRGLGLSTERVDGHFSFCALLFKGTVSRHGRLGSN